MINPALQAFSFLNRADVRGHENRTAQEILSEKDNITMLPVVISNRKAFSDACALGKAVVENIKKNQKASLEIENLIKFVLNYNQ